jgi:transposase
MSSDFAFKLATVKKDRCGDFWVMIAVEGERAYPKNAPPPSNERILVGVDMGLKTTRTAVAVREESGQVAGVYQPERIRFFDRSYLTLVLALRHDKRALPFVHRKIARRRKDSIGKDIEKILSMGDVFKFGKPSTAWLLSGRLARSASDAANSEFLTRFVKRAQSAGKEAGEVDESLTTVSCRKCGTMRKMPLSQRTYTCRNPQCGHVEDRDQNSAYQIAFRQFRECEENTGQANRRATAPRDEILQKKDSQAPPQFKLPHSLGSGVEQV